MPSRVGLLLLVVRWCCSCSAAGDGAVCLQRLASPPQCAAASLSACLCRSPTGSTHHTVCLSRSASLQPTVPLCCQLLLLPLSPCLFNTHPPYPGTSPCPEGQNQGSGRPSWTAGAAHLQAGGFGAQGGCMCGVVVHREGACVIWWCTGRWMAREHKTDRQGCVVWCRV